MNVISVCVLPRRDEREIVVISIVARASFWGRSCERRDDLMALRLPIKRRLLVNRKIDSDRSNSFVLITSAAYIKNANESVKSINRAQP